MRCIIADPGNHAVREAKSYIDEHYASIQSLETVAEQIGCGYVNLRLKFRRITGITLVDYLTEVRLREACRLLLESDYLVKEICWSVGYQSEAYCCKLFRERMGITMKQFRTSKGTTACPSELAI